MEAYALRPADPEGDFARLAAWFSVLEDSPSTEAGLREFYERERGRITQRVAVGESGQLLGFWWAEADRAQPGHSFCYLFVSPGLRGQGIGRRLYEDLARSVGDGVLRVDVRDSDPSSRAFAERCGFTECRHLVAWQLDLDAFDDRPYDAVIAGLLEQGYRFTSMGELGDGEDDRRRLYRLNDITDRETMGADGSGSWADYEDFRQSVCCSKWYRPDGQMLAIDTATGDWAAMSAITRFDDYAYNLHTGVDRRHRGRRLAQAVKVTALRYARAVLQVHTVRTHHNAANLPMIAIDRKLGYVPVSGTWLMEKVPEGLIREPEATR